jgi:hypothetical protein
MMKLNWIIFVKKMWQIAKTKTDFVNVFRGSVSSIRGCGGLQKINGDHWQK